MVIYEHTCELSTKNREKEFLSELQCLHQKYIDKGLRDASLLMIQYGAAYYERLESVCMMLPTGQIENAVEYGKNRENWKELGMWRKGEG